MSDQTECMGTISDGAYLDGEQNELEDVITGVTGVVPAGRT